MSRRSIICLSLRLRLRLRLRQITDLLATDKSRYFSQPRPIIVNCFLPMLACWRASTGASVSQALFTLIRFQTKMELFCSVFKNICVHTYRFRIVFARPHYNAVSVIPSVYTLLYPQCAWPNELDTCAFQYIGPRNWREIEATW